MPIVIGIKREFEFTGNDENGDGCIFPRFPVNHVFVQAFNFRTKNIVKDTNTYLAFPYVVKIGSTIVGICSDGDSHGSSARQVMFVSTDGGLTYQLNFDFYTAATGVFDLSLLEPLLAEGQSVSLKVFNFKKVGGVIQRTTTSIVANGGKNYAVWSRPKLGTDGVLYRTGYAFTGGIGETALLQSTDGGMSWTFKSVMFAGAGRLYNEADIVEKTANNWIAYCREDSTSSLNPLYRSTSSDNGATWSAPVLVDATLINGRQPNLTKLSDGSIILATGDRSGSSGFGGSAGDQVGGFNTTGITVWRSTDNGSTWSFRTRIAPIFSTDGGQPYVVETTSGRVTCAFYQRRKSKDLPIISSCMFDVANL